VNGAAHLAGTYTGTAMVRAGNGQSATFVVQVTITAQPNFEVVGTPTLSLLDQDSRVVILRNTVNTDLTLTPEVPDALSFVTVAPNPVPVGWQRETEVTVTAAPEGARQAGNYAGEIRFSEGGLIEKPVHTIATVSSRPRTNTPAAAVSVARGGTARITLTTHNAGNVNLKSASLQLGDLIPTRTGARTIPAPTGTVDLGAIPIGDSRTAEVAVPVDASLFCGRYIATARITGRPEFQDGASEETAEVTVDVTGCELRPMAFSRNPVRYSQAKSVDIAFAAGGVVTAKVYNMHGVLVRELADRVSISGGQLTWDFKNGKGDLVASGLYLVIAQIDGKEFREKLLFVK
jgi:hypothetical protein